MATLLVNVAPPNPVEPGLALLETRRFIMRNGIKNKLSGRFVLAFVLLLNAVALEGNQESQQSADAASYEQLFEKAVFAEESLGDLDQAIQLYVELLERSQDDQSFVAQAQYRLGLCYLKKGDEDEAVTALQKLIEEFPAQQKLVQEARARLSQLGYATAQEDMSLRMVWTNGGATLGSPSVDGSYLTFTDWSSGDLAVHDLESGRDRRVTDKGSWETPAFAEFSVPSPDGKQIAYAWYVGPGVLYDLRVIDLDGSNAKVVLRDEEIPWVQPIDWSSDGRAILTFLAYEDGEQLGWVDIETGAIHPIGPRRDYPEGKIDLSADQQSLVFGLEQTEGKRARDIYLTDLSSGEENVLVEHPADDRVVGWSPDGNQLIFLSDRTGEWGLWVVDTASGKTTGAPRLVKDSMGQLWPSGQLFPMGFTDSGALYYGIVDDMSDIYVADLGLEATGAAPSKVTHSFEGKNFAPEWSQDGRYLAWISRRDGAYTVVIRDAESDTDREVAVSTQLTRIFGGGWGGIRWSPDSRFVLVAGMAKPQESWQGLFAIDVQTGEIEQIAAAGDNPIRVPVWSPDGKTLYYTVMDTIASRDMETEAETVLYTGNVGNIALSPDGGSLAFTTDAYSGAKEHMLQILPVSGGEPRVVYRSTESDPFAPRTSLSWSPDGEYLIFSTGLSPEALEDDTEVELWRVPVKGGDPESLGIKMPYLRNARIHPDGQRVAFQAGVRKQEVWVIENFIPHSLASR
jgi:Tol biopolymer transport system component